MRSPSFSDNCFASLLQMDNRHRVNKKLPSQKSGDLFSCHFQQLDQCCQSLITQVSQDLPGELLDWPVQPFQQLEPRWRDARYDHSAVLLFPGPLHQTATLEPVDQASDIGIAINHSFGDLAARASFIFRAA